MSSMKRGAGARDPQNTMGCRWKRPGARFMDSRTNVLDRFECFRAFAFKCTYQSGEALTNLLSLLSCFYRK
jgi:hypothetical protein